ncbi:MAG: hypothetical protein KJ914_17045 [Gammaproteobacteria bacterium]|nr:hypothetical protein [Gammaproteobacteria bacterium]MBU1723423.1 hypothetical protein [Gammaproteobacteria bacterium]MBU2003784.1 hypothetical protein [Gammaproteobacteria bacterium]
MSFIRVGGIVLMSSLLLSACMPPDMVNGGVIGGPWVNPWAPPQQPPVYAEPDVDVYKYQGSRQCEGGGVPMASMQQQLQMAGVQIKGSSCGMDGRMYPAFCGGADGRINIFTIPASNVNAALGQGFAPLGNLPGAQRSSCFSGGTSSSSYYDAATPSTTYPYSGSSGDASYYSY